MRFLTIIPLFFAPGLSLMSLDSDCASTEPNSTLATFGPSIKQFSTTSGNGTALQQFTASSTAPSSPSLTQAANSSYTIEAIIQIRISDFIGTATVNLTRTDPTLTSVNMESSTPLVSLNATEDGLHTTMNSSSMVVPSYNSSTIAPLSNWTAGYNNTNGSFSNSLSPSPTALTVFTGEGTLHRHAGMPGIFPFILFQIAVLSVV